MAQDIRDIIKNNADKEIRTMPKEHEIRFEERLDSVFHSKNKTAFSFIKIAASIVILIGLGLGTYHFTKTPTQVSEVVSVKTLGDLSPDLKKVEDYYLASINLELANVKLTPDNKELFDGYIEQLKTLDNEYHNLIEELNTNGPNQESLDALINNLKYRLNLVMRLKNKLKDLENETPETISI